jgi:hypothetical protein
MGYDAAPPGRSSATRPPGNHPVQASIGSCDVRRRVRRAETRIMHFNDLLGPQAVRLARQPHKCTVQMYGCQVARRSGLIAKTSGSVATTAPWSCRAEEMVFPSFDTGSTGYEMASALRGRLELLNMRS